MFHPLPLTPMATTMIAFAAAASAVAMCPPASDELRSRVDPLGHPIVVGKQNGDEMLRTTPPTPGADEQYAREPLARRSSSADVASEIRKLRREHFGGMRKQSVREQGFEKLKQFKQPSSITPLYEELRTEQDDVVLAMLDHVASLGDAGQAALTWMAIMDANPALRHEAERRIRQPASSAALGVLDTALRSGDDMVANRAGSLAGAIGATQAIPLLIAAQATERRAESEGDLAWIAIQTQRSYVQNLIPVTGSNSGAFQPVIGVIGEGVLLRIMDAVVVTYRTEIHNALVNLSSADWGQPTDGFGYDIGAWRTWYEQEYRPMLSRRGDEAERVAKARQLEREAAREDE